MKLFRPASTAAAAAAVAAAVAFAPTPAYADDGWTWITYSGSSPRGGWGYSVVTTGSIMEQLTCDAGEKDGLRTVSQLTRPDGYVVTLHAANGTGSCAETSFYAQNGTYVLKVCLRDGAFGADRHCDRNSFSYP